MLDTDIDLASIETPCTVIDLGALERNLQILADVQARAGCKVLLALKGFAMWRVFPLVARYLAGAATSSVHEARLAHDEMGKEVHAYAPAYSDADFAVLLGLADHIVLNSFSQWRRLRPLAEAWARDRGTGERDAPEFGIRVNPEHSEVAISLYDPCQPCSRLGVTRAQFDGEALDGVSGLHFHTLCELGAEPLVRTLQVVEAKFGAFFPRLRWINLGGGHHITRADYDRDRLVETVVDLRRRTGLDVYLEPGEAIAIGTGILVSTVLDVIHNGMDIALLDISATAHMPDVLEAPYRPDVLGAARPGELPHTYRLGGQTCLAGDVVGDYAFERPLKPGDKVVFLDQAHYTTVKNTTFNGVQLPSLALWDPASRRLEVVRRFGYEDYRGRLS
jgi:carboxynorspermidine decarboxylase